jgi:hypothetical protein
MYNRKALALMRRQKSAIERRDENGHCWRNRGQAVCPLICKRCSALSGTAKAIIKCTNDKAAKVVKKIEVWA